MTNLLDIPRLFGLSAPDTLTELGGGHINRTYLAECGGKRYILQALSNDVFRSPQVVMENISRIEEAVAHADGTVRVPHYLTAEGKNYAAVGGETWRMYEYIGALEVSTPDRARRAGAAFGAFIRLMSGAELTDPIERFHDYNAYFSRLEAVSNGREDSAVMRRLSALGRRLGETFENVPKRSVHGDAKADNVMIGEPCTIIDLDTSMRGYAALDFGDLVRSVCGRAPDIPMIADVSRGFSDGLRGMISPSEIHSLYFGILWATGELAVRYLIDAYSEERYFRDKTPAQCRGRAQELLGQLDRLESCEQQLREIIEKSFRSVL